MVFAFSSLVFAWCSAADRIDQRFVQLVLLHAALSRTLCRPDDLNNWFGFRGVANFARYLAAPVLVLWVVYALIKAVGVTPASALSEPGHQSFAASLVLIPILIVGDSIWGNEADFFRYAKTSKLATIIPLLVSVFIGEILFPVTGWMLGRASGATDVASFTKFMNDYSFGHAPWLAAFVLIVSYFAVNDGNMYGSINGLENLWRTKRHNVVLLLVGLGSVLAYVLSFYASALDAIATLNSILLPCVTMIIIFDYFIADKISAGGVVGRRLSSAKLRISQNWGYGATGDPAGGVDRSFYGLATLSLILAWTVGTATSGIFPQLKSLNVGVWILYAWCTGFALYAIGKAVRLPELRKVQAAAIASPAARTEPELVLSAESER